MTVSGGAAQLADLAATAFGERSWGRAYEALQAADAEAPLPPADLERLATAAYLTGQDETSDDAWVRAHHGWLDRHEPVHAARCAFWLALGLILRGEMARGAGWLGRASRLVEEVEEETSVHGLLLAAAGLQCRAQGEPDQAVSHFERAGDIGRRLGDPDLLAFGLLGHGQALIQAGRVVEGVALLDEVMVAVTADELGATTAGIVYCAVIEACQATYDVARAREWTDALTRWCASQPELVPYRGQCLVYRAEIMQRQGAWDEALSELQDACARLSTPRVHPALGMAMYRLGELHRLCGRFDEAREAYRRADELGHLPQPGLAQLLFSAGEQEAARQSIHAALAAANEPLTRIPILGAAVEILLDAEDVAAAREAADELAALVAEVAPASDLLAALVDQAEGAVRVAAADAEGAVPLLRRALDRWRAIQDPYDAARARMLLAQAYRQLGDDETAEDEARAATDQLQRLGVSDVADAGGREDGGGPRLSSRETEVLALVANGLTNREIAESLAISEHTARRHVQNICAKLDVPSRTAATALAIREGLV